MLSHINFLRSERLCNIDSHLISEESIYLVTYIYIWQIGLFHILHQRTGCTCCGSHRLCNLKADTVTQTCFQVLRHGYLYSVSEHLSLRRSRTADSVIVKQTPILDSYIAMIRKAEYHSHPPPARAAGGGGGGAATAADTATVSNC